MQRWVPVIQAMHGPGMLDTKISVACAVPIPVFPEITRYLWGNLLTRRTVLGQPHFSRRVLSQDQACLDLRRALPIAPPLVPIFLRRRAHRFRGFVQPFPASRGQVALHFWDRLG